MNDKLRTYITCVNYSDFLRLSLPTTKWLKPTIITRKEDTETQELAAMHGCPYYISEAWGATFNKAAAINDVLDTSGWVLLLDADILLPSPFGLPDDKVPLYGARSRHCEKFEDFGKKWENYPYRRSTYKLGENRFRLAGYFHLWWGPSQPEKLPPSPRKDASKYDMKHSERFERVELLPDYEVLHIGESMKNWKGRITEKWEI